MAIQQNAEFGRRVSAVLDEHGLSLRAARIRTGIDHVTISDMRSGIVPRVDKVEAFARAFGFDVNEWRVLAGYEPVDPSPQDAAKVLERMGATVTLPVDAPKKAPSLKDFFANREAQESPFDRMLRLYGELVKWCQTEGYNAPPFSPGFYGGLDSLTDEKADHYIENLRDEAMRGGKKR